MFELKFAITEQKSVSSQAVGALALALVYMVTLTPVFTLPALAEESDPSISSQPFSGWILAPCLKTIA